MGRTLATCKSCQERFDVFSGHTCPNGFRDFSRRATALAAAIVVKKKSRRVKVRYTTGGLTRPPSNDFEELA